MRLLSLAALVLLAGSLAANDTATGPAGTIPASGTGGGGVFPGTLPPTPGISTVTLPGPVSTVSSIEIAGLSHTWIGDLQLVLRDPNGVEHLIFLRPGYNNTSTLGNSGDFLGGTYTFVESGAPNNLPTTSTTAVNPPAGTYNQTFNSGNYLWIDGTAGIFNTPMTTIGGPAGDWSLKFYDWAGGDTGAFTSWTLNYRGGAPSPGTPVCFGDGSGTACPCGNSGGSGAGCVTNFPGDPSDVQCPAAGVQVGTTLTASGSNSLGAQADPTTRLVLTANDTTTQPGLFFSGVNTIGGGSGIGFGDGLRCCGGQVKRLQLTDLPGQGAGVNCPATGSTTVDLTNVTPGTVTAGTKLCYQYWYRNPGARSLCATNFNLSNAITVTWAP